MQLEDHTKPSLLRWVALAIGVSLGIAVIESCLHAPDRWTLGASSGLGTYDNTRDGASYENSVGSIEASVSGGITYPGAPARVGQRANGPTSWWLSEQEAGAAATALEERLASLEQQVASLLDRGEETRDADQGGFPVNDSAQWGLLSLVAAQMVRGMVAGRRSE